MNDLAWLEKEWLESEIAGDIEHRMKQPLGTRAGKHLLGRGRFGVAQR